jgi:hypothetical protein
MAANLIEKSIHLAAPGIAAGTPNEPTIEIELEIEGQPLEVPEEEEAQDFYANLAEGMDDRMLSSLAGDLLKNIKDDLNARRDWEKMCVEGINLLGLKYEDRVDPWQGACGVFHPMITEAVIRFQADTMMETFPATGPVKTKIVGKVTEDKEKAAKRVEDDLNWQLTENMPEFRPDHERMLWNLPGTGCAFKKVYRDPVTDRQTSVFIPAEDVIIPYGTTDLNTCERIAHRMRKTLLDVKKLQEAGFWRDVTVPEQPAQQPDDIRKKKDKEAGVDALSDTRPVIYEVAVDLDLDAYAADDLSPEEAQTSGKAEPYIVTMLDDGVTVLAVRRNWKEGDDKKLKRLHFVQYNYIPGYGAYGFGLFHLLGGFAQSATSIMRQLVDAGTLSNLPGGLKSKGLRIKGDDQPVSPGEFRDVDVGSGTIRDNILPLPYKEPSATLYQLLLNIVEEGRRFASTNDLKVADMSSQAPVGTTLAVLERQLRTMTAVQARVHFSFKQELRLLADIIKEDAEEGGEYSYDVDAPDGTKAKLEDYSYVSIIPVSDPNAATMSQRVVQYQAAIQLANMAPQIYDMPELHRQMLTVLGIKNVGKLVPTEDDIKVVDPVQENQNILMGKPVKAVHWQDHEAHIRVHMAMAQDPMVQQLIGQNPQAQKIMAAMASHVSEHVGFAYRNKMARALGAPLPVLDKDTSLPEEMELQLSRMLAMAAPAVLQESQALMAQQQAQKNAQDPVLVAQMMEQQTNRAEVERKMRKDQADIALEQMRLKIDAVTGGVDPAMVQQEFALEQAKAQMTMEQQKAAAQLMMEYEKLQAQKQREQGQIELERQRKEQEAQTAQARAAVELAARHDQMRMARERHTAEMRIKEEQSKADIAAKKQQAKKKPKGEPK